MICVLFPTQAEEAEAEAEDFLKSLITYLFFAQSSSSVHR